MLNCFAVGAQTTNRQPCPGRGVAPNGGIESELPIKLKPLFKCESRVVKCLRPALPQAPAKKRGAGGHGSPSVTCSLCSKFAKKEYAVLRGEDIGSSL